MESFWSTIFNEIYMMIENYLMLRIMIVHRDNIINSYPLTLSSQLYLSMFMDNYVYDYPLHIDKISCIYL